MLLSSLNQLESSTYQFCEIDIALDDQLVALYGVHIPVLLVESFSDLNQSVTRRELYWPFTVEDVFASVLL